MENINPQIFFGTIKLLDGTFLTINLLQILTIKQENDYKILVLSNNEELKFTGSILKIQVPSSTSIL